VAAGEYVAVEKIESVLKTCPLAEQVWAYGNSFESCLVAVVVPKQKPLMAWADKQGLQGSYEVRECTSRATHISRCTLLYLLTAAATVRIFSACTGSGCRSRQATVQYVHTPERPKGVLLT
jgi:hypothetical protein